MLNEFTTKQPRNRKEKRSNLQRRDLRIHTHKKDLSRDHYESQILTDKSKTFIA